MALTELLDIRGAKVGEIEINDAIFNAEVKTYLIHDVVKAQLAGRRSGTASTKTRKEVAGSGRKLYRQKGTGRARHGNIKAPIYVGGGTAFGPKPRDYSQRLPKKVRKSALRSALTLRYTAAHLKVLDRLELTDISTKNFSGIVKTLSIVKPLIVIDRKDETVEKSARNIPFVKVLRVEGLNVYDVMKHDDLVLTLDALRKIEEVLVP
jgi:large subunit ribosomal protein L4